MKTSIYKITGPDNKIYIGKTVNFKKRIQRHISNAKNGIKHHLYNAMRLYGIKMFKFEEIAIFFNEKDAYEFERFYIEKYDLTNPNKGYNKSIGGIGGRSGVKLSDDEKIHLSNYWKNRKFTKETRLKISRSLTGKKHKESSKTKMSKAKLGKLPSNTKKLVAKNKITGEIKIFNGYRELANFINVKRTCIERFFNKNTKPKKNGKLYNFLNNYKLEVNNE